MSPVPDAAEKRPAPKPPCAALSHPRAAQEGAVGLCLGAIARQLLLIKDYKYTFKIFRFHFFIVSQGGADCGLFRLQ